MKKVYQITFVTELGICRRQANSVIVAIRFQNYLTLLGVDSTLSEIYA